MGRDVARVGAEQTEYRGEGEKEREKCEVPADHLVREQDGEDQHDVGKVGQRGWGRSHRYGQTTADDVSEALDDRQKAHPVSDPHPLLSC